MRPESRELGQLLPGSAPLEAAPAPERDDIEAGASPTEARPAEGTDGPELRVDAEDGNPYSLLEFLQHYGDDDGERRWAAAAPPISTADGLREPWQEEPQQRAVPGQVPPADEPRDEPTSRIGTHRVFKYAGERLVPSECTICLGPYESGQSVSELRCGHTYHASCVDSWLAGHSTCPVCRQTVVLRSERPAEPQPDPQDDLFERLPEAQRLLFLLAGWQHAAVRRRGNVTGPEDSVRPTRRRWLDSVVAADQPGRVGGRRNIGDFGGDGADSESGQPLSWDQDGQLLLVTPPGARDGFDGRPSGSRRLRGPRGMDGMVASRRSSEDDLEDDLEFCGCCFSSDSHRSSGGSCTARHCWECRPQSAGLRPTEHQGGRGRRGWFRCLLIIWVSFLVATVMMIVVTNYTSAGQSVKDRVTTLFLVCTVACTASVLLLLLADLCCCLARTLTAAGRSDVAAGIGGGPRQASSGRGIVLVDLSTGRSGGRIHGWVDSGESMANSRQAADGPTRRVQVPQQPAPRPAAVPPSRSQAAIAPTVATSQNTPVATVSTDTDTAAANTATNAGAADGAEHRDERAERQHNVLTLTPQATPQLPSRSLPTDDATDAMVGLEYEGELARLEAEAHERMERLDANVAEAEAELMETVPSSAVASASVQEPNVAP